MTDILMHLNFMSSSYIAIKAIFRRNDTKLCSIIPLSLDRSPATCLDLDETVTDCLSFKGKDGGLDLEIRIPLDGSGNARWLQGRDEVGFSYKRAELEDL